MEFRLLYSGSLLGASKNDTRAHVKHSIRREFHPQLRRLWATKNKLVEAAQMYGAVEWQNDTQHSDQEAPSNSFELGIDAMSKRWDRFGYKFLPLVTEELCSRCSLEILFLRPEEPGLLIRSGDLDGRIKTIFDALRLPSNLKETGEVGPAEDETPFYCLLEDDKLISEIRVTTDELLLRPKERELKANDVFLLINIKIQRIKEGASMNWIFG